MPYEVNLSNVRPQAVYSLGQDFSGVSPGGDRISFNNYYMELNGRPFFPVSGELHYSRMDDSRWEREIIKMRMGGVNIISTYVLWNHIEEDEGVFDFSGQRDLRRFTEICAKQGLYVILRIGPFSHGEARNGGLPDWLYGKPFRVRSTDAGFMRYVRRLYEKIGEQVRGLFFADGGPVIAVQLDNEYMSSSAPWEMTTGVSGEWIEKGDEGEKYILALRETALECGITPVFFTGTAWGSAAYCEKVMPLWGGYPYRPWIFYSHAGEHPATEEYIYQDYHHDGAECTDDFVPSYPPSARPYACCEMGGGMMCCYNYRFRYPFRSVDALANIKLGSGCNFIGYYMFHGGTNPLGRHGAYLNESQVSKRSYDYQAALGEFGQVRESYSRLKSVHFFTRFFGSRLAPMETVLPAGASRIDPGDLGPLRFAVRTDGESGFLFINNFQDHRDMPPRNHEHIRLETNRETYDFDISISSGENAVFPFSFDMDGILLRQANAQPVLRTQAGGGITYVFMIPEGMDGAFVFEDDAVVSGGADHFTVRKGAASVSVITLSRPEADRLFVLRDGSLILTDGALKEDEKGGLRLETDRPQNTLRCFPASRFEGSCAAREADEGVWGVYRAVAAPRDIPVEVRACAPCRWTIHLPENALQGVFDARLQISYKGDIGTLWLNNTLISDNFCNDDLWEVGLPEHSGEINAGMTLYISPIRKGSRVRTDSGMAARSEEAEDLIADLKNIRVQPVYDIAL